MKYLEDLLENVGPIKNKERYNELKKRIKMEKILIEQIEDEVHRINEELKLEQDKKKDNASP